ncbi:helix-turn-helix transcriptional regulator [Paenibacillus sp. MMO-177]|uniref:helix-turn-helix transcriptional regulator n=1 Tax=Paenibacillus sp. MMO-177 TaxID=3081289 RepID=UPI003018201C
MFHFECPPMPHFVQIGEDTYQPGRKHPDRSSIGVFDLLFVTRGCLYLAEEENELTLPAGHFGILRPDLDHHTAIPCREETHFYWLHFQTTGQWHPEPYDKEPLPPEQEPLYPPIEYFSFYLPRSGPVQSLGRAEELFRELLHLYENPAGNSRWQEQQLFHAILLKLQEDSKEETTQSSHLQLAEDAALYLRKHYRDPLSYKRMAEELHFHANYIALCMKRTFGCTPLDYVTQYRIEQAKRLLIHTNDPVGAIAEDTGFGSFPYFVRCFHKRTGKTPKQFRMLYRQSKPPASI